jgi:signal transduction histidine kinase
MSPLATLLVSFGAVHVFVASCYAFVFYRQRYGGEYLSYAFLSVTLAVYTFCSGIIVDAANGAVASGAQQVQLLSVAAGVPAFLSFVSQLVGYRPARWWRASLGFSALTTIVVLSGLAFDPGDALPTRAPLLDFAPTTKEVVTQPAGIALYLLATFIASGFLLSMRRIAPGNAEMRVLQVIGVITLPPLFLDTLSRALQARTVYLFEHGLVVATLLASYMLMRRFVQAGDELENRTIELRRSYDELRYVQEELVRKEQLAAVGELSAVIAHEVRNPLAVLKNAVSGLRRAELREEDRATLFAILDEETDRLNRLVRDLLAYARPVEPQSTPLPVEQTVRHSVDLACRGHARSSSIEVTIDLEDVPASLEGDKDLIERAFINIVENALQAMPNGGRLVVSGFGSDIDGDSTITLAFRDTGEGMDTLVRSRARDPFFTTRSSGTGLGLAIVERVIRAHGGKVELAKNEDAGSTVKVTLPTRRRLSQIP